MVSATGHVGDSVIEQLIGTATNTRYSLQPWSTEDLRNLAQRIHRLYCAAYEINDISVGEAMYVFHFGGARRQAVLELAARDTPTHAGPMITPWFIRCPPLAGPPSWLLKATTALLELRIIARLDVLERTLARPYANLALPIAIRVDEVRGWLDIDGELNEIHRAQWQVGLDEEVRKVLQGFVHIGNRTG